MAQKGFFDTIPSSIDEAARLDGATNFQVFLKIILPLSKPILVYAALTSFTWPWSDFILPKLLLPTMDNWTVAVGLMYLDETEFARFASGSIFIGVPIVVLYFCLVKISDPRQRCKSPPNGGLFLPSERRCGRLGRASLGRCPQRKLGKMAARGQHTRAA